MKKLFSALFAAALFLTFDAAAVERAELCGTQDLPLSLAGFANYPPFSWKVLVFKGDVETMDRYSYKGFVYQTVKDSLDAYDIVSEDYFQDNFEKLKYEVKHGKTDIFFTSYYEDEKKSNVDYIYPAYFGNPFVIVSLQEKTIDAATFDALSGLRGVVRNEEGIRQLIQPSLPTDTKVEWVDGPRAAFKMLLSGQADFMISSPYAAVAEARRFKVYDKLHISQTPLKSIKLFASWSKMSQCRHLKPKFVEKFNQLMKDPVEKQKRLTAAIEEWVAQNEGEEPLFEEDASSAPAANENPAPEQAAQPAAQTSDETPVEQPAEAPAVLQEENAPSDANENASDRPAPTPAESVGEQEEAETPAAPVQEAEPYRPRVQTFRKFKGRSGY